MDYYCDCIFCIGLEKNKKYRIAFKLKDTDISGGGKKVYKNKYFSILNGIKNRQKKIAHVNFSS